MGPDSVPRKPQVAVIGTGFGGLGMAIQLMKAGFTDITIFEKADDVGGCWRDNTYPGAACDVPSHLYSYSFEPKTDWSRRFAPQPEILGYLRHCARKYDLLRHVRFRTEVLGAAFDEAAGRWRIELSDGILGTGFQATDFLAPMRITGRGGRELNEAWRDGAEAHLGITVSGFPNLFLLYGPNTNLGHSSIVFMLESQIRYVMQAAHRLARGDVTWLDVRAEVQDVFNAKVQERIKATVWDRGCTSWYKTASGKNTNNWPGFTVGYRRRTRRLRLDDFDLQPAGAPAQALLAAKAG